MRTLMVVMRHAVNYKVSLIIDRNVANTKSTCYAPEVRSRWKVLQLFVLQCRTCLHEPDNRRGADGAQDHRPEWGPALNLVPEQSKPPERICWQPGAIRECRPVIRLKVGTCRCKGKPMCPVCKSKIHICIILQKQRVNQLIWFKSWIRFCTG